MVALNNYRRFRWITEKNHTGGTTMISGTVKHSSNVVEKSKLYIERTLPHPYFAMFRRARFTIITELTGTSAKLRPILSAIHLTKEQQCPCSTPAGKLHPVQMVEGSITPSHVLYVSAISKNPMDNVIAKHYLLCVLN